jgi:hypothetical protein
MVCLLWKNNRQVRREGAEKQREVVMGEVKSGKLLACLKTLQWQLRLFRVSTAVGRSI